MTEYIKRKDALAAFCTWCGVCSEGNCDPLNCDDILAGVLKKLPAEDVRPVVRAHWTNHRTLFTDGDWYCSACGKAITIYMGPDREDLYAYCPNCGADMRNSLERVAANPEKSPEEVDADMRGGQADD